MAHCHLHSPSIDPSMFANSQITGLSNISLYQECLKIHVVLMGAKSELRQIMQSIAVYDIHEFSSPKQAEKAKHLLHLSLALALSWAMLLIWVFFPKWNEPLPMILTWLLQINKEGKEGCSGQRSENIVLCVICSKLCLGIDWIFRYEN